MGGFTPFKRNANNFNYTPRFYDPKKEAREQRRAELRGERYDAGIDGERESYEAGRYIRNQREARAAKRATKRSGSSRFKTMLMVVGIVLIAILGSMLYSRVIEAFGLSEREANGSTSTPTAEYEEFDPTAPIVVVPNDYVEAE